MLLDPGSVLAVEVGHLDGVAPLGRQVPRLGAGVGETRLTDHIHEALDRVGYARVGIRARDRGAVDELQRGIFQLNRHQGIPRADVEGTARLVIGPDGALAAHQGLGSGEPLDPHRGISAGQQVFVIRMEQRLVVRHLDVARKHRIHQVADGAASGRPEQRWNAGQHVEVIVDDGLAGDGKQLAIGGQLDGGASIGQGDVLVFRPLPHLAQAGDVTQTDTARHLEVGQGAFARPLIEGFFGMFPAFQHRLVGDIQQDLAKVGTGVSEGHADVGHRGVSAGLNAATIQ
ncbi:hypothetical protein D3C85_596560 [compost metagenome]